MTNKILRQNFRFHVQKRHPRMGTNVPATYLPIQVYLVKNGKRVKRVLTCNTDSNGFTPTVSLSLPVGSQLDVYYLPNGSNSYVKATTKRPFGITSFKWEKPRNANNWGVIYLDYDGETDQNVANKKLKRYKEKQGEQPDGWHNYLSRKIKEMVHGENSAAWSIMASTLIGMVPVLGQIVDAKDIISSIVALKNNLSNSLAWFELFTALIGLVPLVGDLTKGVLRAVKKGKLSPAFMFNQLRGELYDRKKKRGGKITGNAEKALDDVMDFGAMKKRLKQFLAKPEVQKMIPKKVKDTFNNIIEKAQKQFALFKKQIDEWKEMATNTSSDKLAFATPNQAKVNQTKPNTQANAGSKTKTKGADKVEKFKAYFAVAAVGEFAANLTNKAKGLLGEHMADYHCQEVKGWGQNLAKHDQGGTNAKKLNDNSEMIKLFEIKARGRGIDAVWDTDGKGKKPYAIVEAKMSADPTKSLAANLGDARDKNGADRQQSQNSRKKSNRANTKKQNNQFQGESARQSNGKVTQMSKNWIETRLKKSFDKTLYSKISSSGYTRHVLFFSVPEVVKHIEALYFMALGTPKPDSHHADHSLTKEWTDKHIKKVVDDRAK